MRKKLLVVILACILCISFSACEKGNKDQGDNLTDMKTVEEILKQTPAEGLIGKNDIVQFTTVFYTRQIQYSEGFLLRAGNDGNIMPIKLMFPIAHALEVRSNDFKVVFEQGKDYIVEDGILKVPRGSKMSAITEDEFFLPPEGTYDWYYNDKAGEEAGRAVTTDKMMLYKYRYVITYIRTEVYSGNIVPSKADKIPNFKSKCNDESEITMLYVGDSIGEGAGGSGAYSNFAEMTAKGIEQSTGASVNLFNCSVGGIDSLEFMNLVDGHPEKINPNILEKAKQRFSLMEKKKSYADIVFIALGANDSSADRDANVFKLHVQALIDYFRDANPDVSIVAVSSMEINHKIRRGKPHDIRNLRLKDLAEYAAVMAELENEYTNLAFADVHTAQASILQRKYMEDVIADNLNHPSDYMSRLYAQFLLKTIL